MNGVDMCLFVPYISCSFAHKKVRLALNELCRCLLVCKKKINADACLFMRVQYTIKDIFYS